MITSLKKKEEVYKMNKTTIVKKMMFASDVVIYVKKYMEIMDSYYKNYDNRYKDEFSYGEYEEFKKECEKAGRERGLIK